MIHQGFGESFSIVRMRNGMWWFWQSSTNWRGRRTFDVIGKRDPLLKRRGALGWLSRCCTDEPARTHTHTQRHTEPSTCTYPAHFLLWLYFPLKYPQKKNKLRRNFCRVSFGFLFVHRCELMWFFSLCAGRRGKTRQKGGSSGSYLVGFL